MPSPSQHEADFSKGGPGFREDLRAACAVPHVVGRAVLGDKFDLLKLRVCSEQARPYLVDQMLYRAAVELMESALDLVANGPGPEEAGAFGDPLPYIAVPPVHVHTGRQRAGG